MDAMKQIKILIVEDEKVIKELIADYLDMKGYENVFTASSGKEAMERIERDKPDIIFLDIQLTDDIDGMQVLKKSKELSPKTKVIMLSAYQDKYGKEAKELGSYAFLKKPIQISTLDKILKEAIKE
jgi:YesN/AraC family two-component response regulator